MFISRTNFREKHPFGELCLNFVFGCTSNFSLLDYYPPHLKNRRQKQLNEFLIYMTTIIVALLLVLGTLAGLFMTLNYKGELNASVNFRKGEFTVKKKK